MRAAFEQTSSYILEANESIVIGIIIFEIEKQVNQHWLDFLKNKQEEILLLQKK